MTQGIKAIRLFPEPIRSLAFGSIGAGYTGVGTSLVNPIRLLYMANFTDQSLMFSWDGINDHIAIPANGFFLFDAAANQSQIQGAYIAQGIRFYTKYISNPPTTGSAYITVIYATAG